MPYRFATQRQDYSDYASGRVFYNLPGHPAFPIRLANEIFLRCMKIRKTSGCTAPARLYDACCGGAYHLAVLAYFHWENIADITASDIDPDSLSVAARNLSLLTLEGLDRRIQEVSELQSLYGKASHSEALASASVLKGRLAENLSGHSIPTNLFQADALEKGPISDAFGEEKADLVITDVPYGLKSSWQLSNSASEQDAPITRMLDTLTQILSSHAVVAVATTRQDRAAHPGFIQVGKLKLGLRSITFLKPRLP